MTLDRDALIAQFGEPDDLAAANDSVDNRDRAEMARAALRTFADISVPSLDDEWTDNIDEDTTTLAVDLIGDLLHLVCMENADDLGAAATALEQGWSHFRAEVGLGYPDPEDTIG